MFAADFLALATILTLSGVIRHIIKPGYSLESLLDLTPPLIMILVGFWLQGLYPAVLIHVAEEMRRIVFCVTVAFLIAASSAFLWRHLDIFARSVFLVTWAMAAPAVILTRYFVRNACKKFDWWGVSAIILSSGDAAERVSKTLLNPKWGLRVEGILSDDADASWPSHLPPYLGALSAAGSITQHSFEYAIIAMPQKSSREIRKVIQSCCHGFNNVLLVPDMPELFSLGIIARQMGAEIGFEVPQRLAQRGPAVVKRLIDCTLALFALLILLPVFALLSMCVALSSPGPILYGQRRYGRNGETFKALKFRTMVSNADQILATYLSDHPECLFEWQRNHKLKQDPRITPIGKWMRRLSLDELPQLLNVIWGQMSLVGPRPIVEAEIEKYGDCYDLYSRVRPGITGLWQISGRNNTTYSERVAIDQYYVNNWSIWIDVYILARTMRTVLTAEGAY